MLPGYALTVSRETFTLEERSLVFKEDSHAPLATSDMSDWLSALGKALGKQRLVDKAFTWSKWTTGEYGADAFADVSALDVDDLQNAGMPKAQGSHNRRTCFPTHNEGKRPFLKIPLLEFHKSW